MEGRGNDVLEANGGYEVSTYYQSRPAREGEGKGE